MLEAASQKRIFALLTKYYVQYISPPHILNVTKILKVALHQVQHLHLHIIYWHNNSLTHFYIEKAFICFIEVEVMSVTLLFASVPLSLTLCLVSCCCPTGMVSCHCPTGMLSCCCLTGLPHDGTSMVRLLFQLSKVMASDVDADWTLICCV